MFLLFTIALFLVLFVNVEFFFVVGFDMVVLFIVLFFVVVYFIFILLLLVLILSFFFSMSKVKTGGVRFAQLLEIVSKVDPEIRFRFTSPHPKDFPDEVFIAILILYYIIVIRQLVLFILIKLFFCFNNVFSYSISSAIPQTYVNRYICPRNLEVLKY